MLALGAVAGLVRAERSEPATFFVDGESGSDAADGTRQDKAWQSLERVSSADLIPGDRVLFKSGGLWRGTLKPQSGTPESRILYGAYGTGAKPILQGSVARSLPEEWIEVKPGLWATRPFEPKTLEPIMDLSDSHWSSSFQEAAKGTLTRVQENGRWFNRVSCKTPGDKRHLIQIWGPQIKELGPCLMLRIRVRSTLPFKLDTFEAMLNHPPWTGSLSGHVGRKEIGTEWQTLNVLMLEQNKTDAAYLHFCLGGMIPAGASFDFEPIGLWRANIDHCDPIIFDAGILILNHGEKWGVKKWRKEDLTDALDYWYDAEDKRVFVANKTNPAVAFNSVELALTRHIINQGGKHDIIYDGLAIRYGGAHGFGGGNTKRITIRNCDLSWIGGGLQFFKPNGHPVRFGNAIEFWGGAEDHLVEHNRIWEVYDAALTNQGNGEDSNQINIIYRDNIIWNAEYSFEFWNRPATAITRNIIFEHNTCVDAGSCWSHAQRPDPNGAHLMFYQNPSATTGFVVRNNIFVKTSEVCTRMENDWRKGLVIQNNLYWSPDKPILRWLSKNYYAASDFARYQAELALDTHSLVAEPQFVDPAARDYRLKPGSPGLTLATDGGPVGARW
jgi:hypothetical protein